MKKIQVSLLLTFLLFTSNISYAKYVQTCKVKYKVEIGWPKIYEIQVSFMQGDELNEATDSFKYKSSSTYAIIFWSDEQVTTIKLDTDKCGRGLYYGNNICDYDDFHGRFDKGYIEGTDNDDREWKVCYTNDCSY